MHCASPLNLAVSPRIETRVRCPGMNLNDITSVAATSTELSTDSSECGNSSQSSCVGVQGIFGVRKGYPQKGWKWEGGVPSS